MKIICPATHARQRGGATLVVLLMIGILALFTSANRRANVGLNDELNRIEAEQIQRLQAQRVENDR